MQVAFWVVIAIVTVLTYRQAKQTFFQPFLTESFKAQLAALTRLSDEFAGLQWYEIDDHFDFPAVTLSSSWRLFDSYAEDVLFAESRDLAGILEGIELPPGPDRDIALGQHPHWKYAGTRPSAADVSREWETWSVERLVSNAVFSTRRYDEQLARVTRLGSDPVLPSAVRSAASELVAAVQTNMFEVSNAAGTASANLISKYPNPKQLSYAAADDVGAEWRTSRADLMPLVSALLTSITDHIKPDRLGYATEPRTGRSRS